MPAPFPFLQRNAQLPQMAMERDFIFQGTWSTCQVTLQSASTVTPWPMPQLHVPWVPMGSHHLVLRCSIWTDVDYCALINAVISSAAFIWFQSQDWERKAKWPYIQNSLLLKRKYKFAESCLRVGMTHQFWPLWSIITTVGVILKDSQTVLQLCLHSQAQRRNRKKSGWSSAKTATQLLSLEKIQEQ